MVIANVLPNLQTVNIFVTTLCKKRRFRTRFDIPHLKASQILAKSPWERFYLVFSSFSEKLIWKMSPLVSDEILGFLFTYWLPMANIIFRVFRISNSEMKCNYLKEEKPFLDFLLHFLNLHQILNTLKEKMIVVANVFSKLQNVNIFVGKLCKEYRFRNGFGSQHVKACQLLAKSQGQSFYEVFLSFSVRLIWKMSPLVLGEILGVFVNILTADGKYPVDGLENLELPIQMQFSAK